MLRSADQNNRTYHFYLGNERALLKHIQPLLVPACAGDPSNHYQAVCRYLDTQEDAFQANRAEIIQVVYPDGFAAEDLRLYDKDNPWHTQSHRQIPLLPGLAQVVNLSSDTVDNRYISSLSVERYDIDFDACDLQLNIISLAALPRKFATLETTIGMRFYEAMIAPQTRGESLKPGFVKTQQAGLARFIDMSIDYGWLHPVTEMPVTRLARNLAY